MTAKHCVTGLARPEQKAGYLLIFPFYTFFFFFVFFPVLMNIVLSFTDYDLTSMRFVGLRNYASLFKDPFFLASLKNTLVYTLATLSLTMVLGLALALCLQDGMGVKKLVRGAAFFPYLTSMVAASMIWTLIYEPTAGVLNQLMAALQLPGRLWLYDAKYALGGIVVMSTWKYLGYNVLIFIAGLQGIPAALYEAATIDGANARQRFWHVTMPMLRPITFFLFVTGIIHNANAFEQISIMTDGGPMNATTTIVHQIYNRAFNHFKLGYASAIAVALLVITLLVTLLNFRFGNQGNDVELG